MSAKVSMTMKHITLIFLLSLFCESQAYAWTKSLDFEDTVDGQTTKLGFGGRSLTRASNNFSHSGNMGIEMGITAGDTGFRQWGGHLSLPPKSIPSAAAPKEGSEIWYRIWYYFPKGFDFSSSGAGLKLSRVHTASASGDHEGYMTLLIKSGLSVINPIGGPNFYSSNKTTNLGTQVPNGQWHVIEHYVKFHSVPGKAVYRVWQNGKLIFEDMLSPTLKSSSSKVDFMYFFTYWNGGAPKTQQAYIDDMVVTTDRPDNTDSSGNPYIGVGAAKFTAPPNPPIILE